MHPLFLLPAFLNNVIQVLNVARQGLLTTSIYSVEVTSKEMRGTLYTLSGVFRSLGIILSYTLGLFFRWWKVAQFNLPIPVIALALSIFIPESPIFLVKVGKDGLAKRSLLKLRSSLRPRSAACNKNSDNSAVDAEVKIIRSGLDRAMSDSKYSFITLWRRFVNRPEVYKPFGIIILLHFVQQFSGLSILRAYAVEVFDTVFTKAGPENSFGLGNVTNCTSAGEEFGATSSNAYISAIVVGTTRLMASLLLSQLLKKFRRRLLYFTSITLSILALCMFAACHLVISNSTQQDSIESTVFQWSSLLIACLLVFSAQLGIQTLPGLLSGELYPSDTRSALKGFTRSVTSIFIMFPLYFFPIVKESLKLYGTFFTFAGILLFASPIIYKILPETKGLRLEDIQVYFLHPNIGPHDNSKLERNQEERRE